MIIIYQIVVSVDRIELHPDDRIILSVLDRAQHLDPAADVGDDFRLRDERDGRTSIQTERHRYERRQADQRFQIHYCYFSVNFIQYFF